MAPVEHETSAPVLRATRAPDSPLRAPGPTLQPPRAPKNAPAIAAGTGLLVTSAATASLFAAGVMLPAIGLALAISAVATLAYATYYFIGRSEMMARYADTPGVGQSTQRRYHAQRIVGLIVFGAIPAGVALALPGGLIAAGLCAPAVLPALIFVGASALVLLPIVALSGSREKSWADYPEIRHDRWNVGRTVAHVGTRAAYLFAYESMFRGVLLFTLASTLGVVPALVGMTALYFVAHLDKPMGERLGTIPMGIVFGAAALLSGSFVPVFVAHLAISLTMDFFAAKANPDIAFTLRR